MKGLHEMLVNLIFAVIMEPKESLNNNISLAFLGSVTERLKQKCEWPEEAYNKAKRACIRKSVRSKSKSFINSFFPNDQKYGFYIRTVVAEIADITIPSEMYQNVVTKKILDTSFSIFNSSDSNSAIIASELADLHLNETGTTNFDAFEEGALRNEFLQFTKMENYLFSYENT